MAKANMISEEFILIAIHPRAQHKVFWQSFIKLTFGEVPIALEELDQFTEVGACGTAAIITPIYSITRGKKRWTFGKPDEAGKTLKKLYDCFQGIQYGEKEDKYGWLVEV